MKLFKEKLAWAAPIAVILIIALFSINLFAQGDPKGRNLPVALIVNDEGAHVEAVEKALEQMSKGSGEGEPMFAFTEEKEEEIKDLFKDKQYYAALVIPEGYNDQLGHVLINKSPATLKIYINQGYNVTGANMAKNALNTLISQLNQQYYSNFATQLAGQKIDLNSASVLVNPIVTEEKSV
jgi:YhgE/Pip-like protein